MIFRSLSALAVLLAAAPANADYEYDPADLPAGFECDAQLSAEECAREARFEAWYRKYNERVDYWQHVLLFNTEIYFARGVSPPPDWDEASPYHEHQKWLGYETSNLVDAFYSIALRRGQGWAFAINEDAQLRMVRRKSDDEISPEVLEKYYWWMPTTLAETAEELVVRWKFEQADLRQCDGAITHLLAFPAQKGEQFWNEGELGLVLGVPANPKPDWITVTADGDGIFVRARGVTAYSSSMPLVGSPYIIYDQRNDGSGYDWAIKMEEIVRPCLVASDAVSPWEMLLQAQSDAGSDD